MSVQPLLQIRSFKRVSPKLHSDDQYTTIYAAGFYLRDSDMILVKTTEHGSEEGLKPSKVMKDQRMQAMMCSKQQTNATS